MSGNENNDCEMTTSSTLSCVESNHIDNISDHVKYNESGFENSHTNSLNDNESSNDTCALVLAPKTRTDPNDNCDIQIKDLDNQNDINSIKTNHQSTISIKEDQCEKIKLETISDHKEDLVENSKTSVVNTKLEGSIELLKESSSKALSNNDSNVEEINLKNVSNKKQNKFSSSIVNDQNHNHEDSGAQSVEIHAEVPVKINTRPQRQAAKKAESQIREITKEIINPVDNIEEKVIEVIEELSSPLKKVCCQCNRFRLCNYSIRSHKNMFLCQEECVANYQRKTSQIGVEKKCEYCQTTIYQNDDNYFNWQTKYFCSVNCLDQFQHLVLGSNCSKCEQVITSDTNFGKYCRYINRNILQFCGNACLDSYEEGLKLCTFCQKKLPENEPKDFCSSFCQTKDYESRKKKVLPMKYSSGQSLDDNTSLTNKCSICSYKLDDSSANMIQIISDSNLVIQYCSNECLNKFLVLKKKTVSCITCKLKKFNFDMICTSNPASSSVVVYLCSLHCLNQCPELSKKRNMKVICDKCGTQSLACYKTIINTKTFNFCSQSCLNVFQSSKKQKQKTISKNSVENQSSYFRVSTRKSARKEENHYTNSYGGYSSQSKSPKGKSKVRKQIIYEETRSPTLVDKEVQTDQTGSKGVIIPIPVPVYIPMPMHMFTTPYPVPVPIPIPLPIPIFIPTTKNTIKGIFKDIKKIQEETPTDPFEAELLLMAGMVAQEKTENHSSSDSENDTAIDYNDDTKVVSSSARNHNSFGDDVLAMAFNMAGGNTDSINETDNVSNMSTNNDRDPMIDDVEANLVSSTIMPQTSNAINDVTQENMISSPLDPLRRPPRKRAPRTQSQRNTSLKRARKNDYAPVSSLPLSNTRLKPQQQEVQNSHYTMSSPVVKPDANMCLKFTLGVNAWRQWASSKSIEFENTLALNIPVIKKTNIFKLDLLQLTASELNYSLCLFVKELRKPNGSEYAPDTIYYLCLGIQQYLFENGRIDNIFTDIAYEKFTDTLNEIAKKFSEIYNDAKYIVTRVEEEYLWESKQLGAHSPYVLLCTLIFFNTKHFNLTSVEEHMQLSFSHIMKHWKRNPNQPSTSGTKPPSTYRNVLLRFYPPQAALDLPNSRKKKVYEQHENEENPLRCPVKLYEFYLSKCPESVKTRNDLFYLTPERSCVPDSPVWYSTMPLDKKSLEKMLYRVKMVKEINVALLSS